LSDAVSGKFFVLPFAYAVAIGASQHFDNLVNAKIKATPFPNTIDTGKEFLRGKRAVVGLARGETVVARVAVWLSSRLSEITQQRRPATLAALGIMDNLLQLLARDFAFLWIGFLIDELRVLYGIARAKEQEAFAGQAVAPGAASFLIIAFDVLRQIVMNHESHVGFVDAHPKSDSRANHTHFVA